MDERLIKSEDLVQLARLALLGKQKDVQLYVRRLVHRYRIAVPELANELGALLRNSPQSSPLRGAVVDAVPVDLDSRLQLARTEDPVTLEIRPVWDPRVKEQLERVVSERRRDTELLAAGLHATKSALFTGPPGVGKTLAARWLAKELHRPLVVLDLAAVMSSFLGRTGNNVRNVLDYAKGLECVFLLDELDAVAKRRDDAIEVGELKRLVTVLLQEIDGWPSSGFLVAATNHPELLDPAVWRRFEVIIEFPMPSEEQLREAVSQHLQTDGEAVPWANVVARSLQGLSYADADRELLAARRNAVLNHEPLLQSVQRLVQQRASQLGRDARGRLATSLLELGISQREAHRWTGVSRDTMRLRKAQ